MAQVKLQHSALPVMILDKICQRTLITGVSGNIGIALAEEFASHGHPVVINSPLSGELAAIASKVQETHGVEVIPIGLDLRSPNAEKALFDELRRRDKPISILVNNSGAGFEGCFSKTPVGWDIDIIRLNLVALSRMINLFLPEMIRLNAGIILNTSCVIELNSESLLPVYRASKQFIHSYTGNLAWELAHTRVVVKALFAGPRAHCSSREVPPDNSCIYFNKLFTPKAFAKLAYDSILASDPTAKNAENENVGHIVAALRSGPRAQAWPRSES
jgi:short-subunit dehydrogenase